jgi:transcriptional regulator with XRE-family HTH domain
MAAKIPPLPGLALMLLRIVHGWTAKALAGKVGISSSTLSAYECGDITLTRERLGELARAMGLGEEHVEQALFAAGLILPSARVPWTPVDPTPAESRVIEKAAALAGRETADTVRRDLLHELREQKAQRALDEGKVLAARLKPYSEAVRRDLVDGAPDYQHWGLAVVLCHESERAAAHDPREALKLAELALFVAERVPGPDAWRSRLQGWCTGFLANAERVGNEALAADATFVRAWDLWRAGEDEAGLLSEARLLDLESSLRADQRLFAEALRLHAEALAAARPDEIAHLLLNKACTLQEQGQHGSALLVLEQAAQAIDGERQPRLRCVLLFNQASNICRLGQAARAVPIVHEVRALAERLRNDVDLVRTLWLEGNVAAGLGHRQEALEALEQVRRDFEARTLPYDYALVSLDLALVYREEGRSMEIKALAGEILKIFEAQRVHREALAAVVLFRQAAEKEQITTDLVRRLQDYLSKARRNPELRFDA